MGKEDVLRQLFFREGSKARLTDSEGSFEGMFYKKYVDPSFVLDSPGIIVVYRQGEEIVQDLLLWEDITDVCTNGSVGISYQNQYRQVLRDDQNDPDMDWFPIYNAAMSRAQDTPKYAVVMVDMQEGFLLRVDPNKKDKLVQANVNLLEFCKTHNIPVAAVCGYGDTLSQEIGLALEKVPNRGEFRRHVLRNDRDSQDGFRSTNLIEKLKEWESTHLIATGIFANSCLQMTCESAIRNGYFISTADTLIGERPNYQPMYRNFYQCNGNFLRDENTLIEAIKARL